MDLQRASTNSIPEILAPAGDLESLDAALEAGADAVYFGLDEGFNARAKARGFSIQTLPETVARIHAAGTRAYLTLNTLVFESELPQVVDILHAAASSGVDALIVQDPAVCLLAQSIAPTLAIHASTQMTISSPEAARFAASLGARRAVVPRELSVAQIERFAAATSIELEVFVHGALCMSWSGQCLSGEAWLGRSANRGQCNQGCRLPYDLYVDGEHRPLGSEKYLLSPQDLAAIEHIPALMRAGVASLKIEGRYKGPHYVRHNVELYQLARSEKPDLEALNRAHVDSAIAYSRGFGPGHLGGSQHQNLVDGHWPKHRGILFGTVKSHRGSRIRVSLAAPSGANRFTLPILPSSTSPHETPFPQLGQGIVIDGGHPEDAEEAGGRIFAIERQRESEIELDLGHRARNMHKVRPGDRVWINGHAPTRRNTSPVKRAHIFVDIHVSGRVGQPLTLDIRIPQYQIERRICGTSPLEAATGTGLDESRIREKLGNLGSAQFELRTVDVSQLDEGLFLRPSELKAIRREAASELESVVESARHHRVQNQSSGPDLIHTIRTSIAAKNLDASLDETKTKPTWVVLCRTFEQLESCIDAGIEEVDLDWMEFVGLRQAVERARSANLRVNIATVRVQKPGEEGYDRRIESLAPDGVLIRHFGALVHFATIPTSQRPLLHGDFSLNVTNSLTALSLMERGLDTITASHDLNESQLYEMLQASPRLPLTITLHHHLALFHNDHCLYAKHLSDGQDFRSCGRPCDRHRIHLRDHQKHDHPVIVDVECRNTVFNAQAQSAATYFAAMRSRGLARFRIEFAWEDKAQSRRVLESYLALGNETLPATEVISRIQSIERFGVSAGTVAHESKLHVIGKHPTLGRP